MLHEWFLGGKGTIYINIKDTIYININKII